MMILKASVTMLAVITFGGSFVEAQPQPPRSAAPTAALAAPQDGQADLAHRDSLPSRDVGALVALTLLLIVVGRGRHRRDRVEVLAS